MKLHPDYTRNQLLEKRVLMLKSKRDYSMPTKANDYSKVFVEANRNADLQKGKMELQVYTELKMTLEELESFCAMNSAKTLLDVYKEYYEMQFFMMQSKHNKMLSDAQKYSELQHETEKERTETMRRIHERIDREKQLFTIFHRKIKELLHLEGFFDKAELS